MRTSDWAMMAHKIAEDNPGIGMSKVDLARAMIKAWGNDQDSAVWTVDDVLCRAAELGKLDYISRDDARTILGDLIEDLEGHRGLVALDELIYDTAMSYEGDDE